MTWFFKKEEKTISPAPMAVSTDKQVLDSLVVNSLDAIVVYNTDFQILIFNKAAETLCGVPADQIIGQKFSLERAGQISSKVLANIMFPSLAPTVIRQSSEGVYPQVLDLIIDEPRFELRIFLNRITDAQGQTLGFVKIIHDQTREREFFRSQQDFISVAAHQLRTPATAVTWAFENLVKDQSLGKEALDLVSIGQAAGKNLMKIINDILNIAQIEEGRFGYQFQETNLVEFFDKLLAEAEPIAKEYKVKIYLERPDQSVIVPIDAVRLGLAVANLIDNAIKYNMVGGEVVVSIQKLTDKPMVKISVKDTGPGILPEDMKRLFTKFFRGANVNKFSVEGSGLGLYITKNVIERHGGTIWVESVVGRGTIFFFTLPTDRKLIPVR